MPKLRNPATSEERAKTAPGKTAEEYERIAKQRRAALQAYREKRAAKQKAGAGGNMLAVDAYVKGLTE